jgi:hypothetical protein
LFFFFKETNRQKIELHEDLDHHGHRAPSDCCVVEDDVYVLLDRPAASSSFSWPHVSRSSRAGRSSRQSNGGTQTHHEEDYG